MLLVSNYTHETNETEPVYIILQASYWVFAASDTCSKKSYPRHLYVYVITYNVLILDIKPLPAYKWAYVSLTKLALLLFT